MSELICTSLTYRHIIRHIQSPTAINAFIISEHETANPPIQQNILQCPLPSANKTESSIYGCVRNDPCLELPCKSYHLLYFCN